MKIETELLENRTARLTVEIEESTLEKAKRDAARRLSKRVNIRGFRKGKAPYNVLARYLGEGEILEEALDKIGPQIYREALEEAELEPYGPGQLENVETDPTLALVFTLPLQPVIDLGDYRDLRLDYEAPEVTDEMVNDALKYLQNSKAVVEPKDGPAELEDQVKLLVYAVLPPAEEKTEDASDSDNGEESDDADSAESSDDADDVEVLFDDEELQLVLTEDGNEPAPGFMAELVGINAEEDRVFSLTYPADSDSDYPENLLGRTVKFQVECQEVSSRHVHTLNDAFAQQVTEGKTETLLEFRIEMRNDLSTQMNQRAEQDYAEAVLEELVEQTDFEYPELLVEDYIDNIVQQIERQISTQGMNLQDYLQLTQTDESDFREQYRDAAIMRAKRSLALGEFIECEQLTADDDAVTGEITQRSIDFSGGNEELQNTMKEYLSSDQQRQEIALDMIGKLAYRRLREIGWGENPPIGMPESEEAESETPPEQSAQEQDGQEEENTDEVSPDTTS